MLRGLSASLWLMMESLLRGKCLTGRIESGKVWRCGWVSGCTINVGAVDVCTWVLGWCALLLSISYLGVNVLGVGWWQVLIRSLVWTSSAIHQVGGSRGEDGIR